MPLFNISWKLSPNSCSRFVESLLLISTAGTGLYFFSIFPTEFRVDTKGEQALSEFASLLLLGGYMNTRYQSRNIFSMATSCMVSGLVVILCLVDHECASRLVTFEHKVTTQSCPRTHRNVTVILVKDQTAC